MKESAEPSGTRKQRVMLGVEQWLFLEHLADRNFFNGNTGRLAARRKFRRVTGVVPGRRHKKAARIFQAMGHNAAQNDVLFNALFGRLGVFDGVTAAAVQQPMIPPRRAMTKIPLLDQNRLEAAHG
jgi:hypothetical protein